MNPSRKMCTMRKVDKVTPIEGADRIEAVHVGGWIVVDQKNLWHEGDFCAYYEIDSFLPTNDDRYSFLAQFGEKLMDMRGVPILGHVLKTRRLRGQYSQGLIMKPEVAFPNVPEHAYQEMYENRARLDGLANVCEYVPESNSMSAGFIGKYDSYVAPRTDAERVQNIDDNVFELIKRTDYFTSVKVDGTSITMCYDPRVNRYRIFSHNNEFNLEEPGIGMTALGCAKEQGLYDWCLEHPGMSVQCELCGSKIGGNMLNLARYRLFVFSLWDMDARKYITAEQWDKTITDAASPMVDGEYGKRFLDQFDAPSQLIDWTNGLRGRVVRDVLDEGIVIHVTCVDNLSASEQMALRNALGMTMQMKSVSSAFLLRKDKKRG